MAWYRTGAVSLTTGSNVVTGTGTDWKKNINGIGQGQALVANKTRVEIMYVDSDTQIRLAEPWSEPSYSGAYHIETAFAGTTGDSARQVMAALFLWKQMGVDWDEWLTSEAATVEVTNVFGEKVTIPTWKALSGASALMDAVESLGRDSSVNWKGTQTVVSLAKGYRMQVGLNDGWNSLGVGYIASQKEDTWSILQIPHEAGTRQIASRQWSDSRFVVSSAHANTGGVDSVGNGSVNFSNALGRLYRTADGTITIFSRPAEGEAYSTNFRIPATSGVAIAADRSWVADNHLPCRREAVTTLPGTTDRYTWSATGSALSYAKGINFGYPGSSNSDTGQIYIGYNGKGYLYFLNSGSNGGKFGGEIALIGSSVTVDGNGFLKRASPIITINAKGYTTNRESRGAKVARLGAGEYEIRNVLGYNSDGAWGVNGGVSVPKDNNGLELVYIKDEIQPDGSIIIRTFHRQHSHLPEMFQNTRKKPDGSPYADGEPCDLPPYSRLDVRVQMPEDCVYNQQKMMDERRMSLFGILTAMQKALSDDTLYLSAPADI